MSPVPLYLCISLSLLTSLRLSLYFNKFITFRVRRTNALSTQEPREIKSPLFQVTETRMTQALMPKFDRLIGVSSCEVGLLRFASGSD